MHLLVTRCQNFLIIILSLYAINAGAINFSSTHLTLSCENRGQVDVLFHVYGHVQEVWEGNFEVAFGHKTSKGYDIVFFRNGDVLFHDVFSDAFSYHYYDNDRDVHPCRKVAERGTHPLNLIRVD